MNAGARHCADINGTFYGQDFSRACTPKSGASIEEIHTTAMPVDLEPDAPRTPLVERLTEEDFYALMCFYVTLPRRREAA